MIVYQSIDSNSKFLSKLYLDKNEAIWQQNWAYINFTLTINWTYINFTLTINFINNDDSLANKTGLVIQIYLFTPLEMLIKQ